MLCSGDQGYIGTFPVYLRMALILTDFPTSEQEVGRNDVCCWKSVNIRFLCIQDVHFSTKAVCLFFILKLLFQSFLPVPVLTWKLVTLNSSRLLIGHKIIPTPLIGYSQSTPHRAVVSNWWFWICCWRAAVPLIRYISMMVSI